MTYKAERSFEQRVAEAGRMKINYPDKFGIIIERHPSCEDRIPHLDRRKYLISNTMTVGNFQCFIQKRCQLHHEDTLVLFCGNTILSCSHMINEVYKEHCDVDGFLYITYSGESTFG